MTERLPKITVKPDVTPDEFIRRLLALANMQETWNVKNSNVTETDIISDILLEISDKAASKFNVPQDIMLHIGYFPRLDSNRVRVQMLARNWADVTPTYESYVKAANLAKPFLSLYNKQFKARVRLNIQTREYLIPKLSPLVEMYFSSFVSLANKVSLHPTDWDLFYGFIYISHRLRCKLTESDIAYLLNRAGFDIDYARHIASVYQHGRNLLKGGCPLDSWGLIELHRKLSETWEKGGTQ
ncbi:hypothetical protein ACFLXL_02870 [Chloroflexota bacterium]